MMRSGNGGLKGIQRVGFMTTTTTTTTTADRSRRCVRFPTRGMANLNDYANLGLSPFASKSDVKFAYKRLALKYHPDVIKSEQVAEKHEIFREIKSSYESLMQKFEEEEQMRTMQDYGEFDEWEEWMGFEGGVPATYHSF